MRGSFVNILFRNSKIICVFQVFLAPLCYQVACTREPGAEAIASADEGQEERTAQGVAGEGGHRRHVPLPYDIRHIQRLLLAILPNCEAISL